MLINGIMTNFEVWYGVSDAEISQLGKVDEYLLREIMDAHSKTAREFLYLETGTIPLRFLVMSRRLSYLHHLLTRNENELIHKFFKAQERCPIKDDWVTQIKEDREYLKLDMTNEEIASTKKSQFKKIIRKKIKEAAFAYLEEIKMSHTKVQNLKYDSLKMQEYLYKFQTRDAQLLFKLRSRMLNVRSNFRNFYKVQDVFCKLCNKDIEQTQAHLLDCETLINNCQDLYNDCDVEFEDIFEGPERQLKAAKLFQAVLETRENLYEDNIM